MNRLIELASKLTPAQVKEVEDFAEFLSFRKPAAVQESIPKPGV